MATKKKTSAFGLATGIASGIASSIAAGTAKAIANSKKSSSGSSSSGKSSCSSSGSGYYDPSRNYAADIDAAIKSGASADVVAKLQQERNNKIAANQDHYSALGISGTDKYGSAASDYISKSNPYANTDYHQAAIDAAKLGDWDTVIEALKNREQKVAAQGGDDRGKSSTEIYKELIDQYYAQPQLEIPEAPTYGGSRYDDSLQQIIDQLTNQTYEDWTKGDQYAALAGRYGQNGEMAMRDVLAQISARTGGLASSYAQSAAQQQYNDYMAKLEEAARQMYDAERSEGLDNAQMLAQLAQQDYARYQDELAQWNADRTFSWNQSQAEREWQYQQNRDAIEDSRYDQEYADSQNQAEQSAALEKAETLAAYGDFSGYKALGYTDAQINLMKAAYQSQLAAQQASKKPSGSSGGGSSKPRLTAAQTVEALEKGIMNDSTLAAYEYYFGQPYDDGSESETTPQTFTNSSGVTATPLDFETIKNNSEAGNYGRKYGLVLGEIQAKFAKGADAGTLADIIDKALKNGDINEAGADTLFRALGY